MAAHRLIGNAWLRSMARPRLALSVIILVILALVPARALAYDNLSAHPKINSEAYLRFVERAKADAWLADTTLEGRKALGTAVAETGLLSIREEAREMSVADWLAHGGMSADEPELPASFRHFFDPVQNAGVAYLTDHIDDLLDYGYGLGGAVVSGVGVIVTLPDTTNPKVDARWWALSHPANRFSYAKAIEYYRTALARQQRLSQDATGLPVGTIPEYGNAWRAVGETMHLMADMTVPSHVRNDSHPYVPILSYKLGNPDPYESTIKAAEIASFAGGSPSSLVDYNTEDLHSLFESVARWTNENFFSIDTVPYGFGYKTTYNGQPEYPYPTLSQSVTTFDGIYYLRQIEAGQTVPIIRQSLLETLSLLTDEWYGDDRPQIYAMDLPVLNAQRTFLIPTAVEASSRVIDAFLPRFKAEFTVKPASATTYALTGRLLHQATDAWPQAPAVNNGAHLEYKAPGSASKQIIWLPNSAFKSGNRIEYEFEAEPGGWVSLNWDLGGYLIRSNPQTLIGITLDARAKTAGNLYVGEDIVFEAILSDPTYSLSSVHLEWRFGDGTADHGQTLLVAGGRAAGEPTHTFNRPGEYAITVTASDLASGKVLASAQVAAMIEAHSIQIYPRGITGNPGVAVEVSCLPANEQYQYEWTFGDGNTVKGNKAVVQHAYVKGGTYDLTVKLFVGSDSSAPSVATDSITVSISSGGECPLCGLTHETYTQRIEAKKIYYVDSQGIRQCLFSQFHDEAKTKLSYQGCYVDGKRVGVWTTYNESGLRHVEDPYVDGVQHGIYRYYDYQTGVIRQETEYRNGINEGLHVEWQTVTVGPLAGQNVKQREGQLVFIAELNYPVRDGFWTFWWPDGTKESEGTLSLGVKEGFWREYYMGDNPKSEGNYHLDQPIGKWTLWSYYWDANGYNRGYKWEGEYIAGKRQGTWIERNPSGWETGTYVDDARKGEWIMYYSDGRVRLRTTY